VKTFLTKGKIRREQWFEGVEKGVGKGLERRGRKGAGGNIL